jgi:hypothetical protein
MNYNVGDFSIKCKVIDLVIGEQKTNQQGESYDSPTHFTTYLPSSNQANAFALTKVKCSNAQLTKLREGQEINSLINLRSWKNGSTYGLSISLPETKETTSESSELENKWAGLEQSES